MSDLLKQILGYVALAGFLSALGVHIATLLGIDVQQSFPYVTSLRE